MKKALISLLVAGALAAVSGCNSMMSADSPWAPREKQKSATERWSERDRQAAQKTEKTEPAQKSASAAAVPAETREIAEVVFTEEAKKFIVAYRLGGIRPKLQKGDKLAVRAKDMTLRGVARLDVIDGETLGFALVAGAAAVGDLLAIPGEALGKEMAEKFPPQDVPADADAPEPAAP